jgi:hypothetical protein
VTFDRFSAFFPPRLAAALVPLLGILLAAAFAAEPAAESCTFEGIERIVAVGDVHGSYDRLAAILRTAGLIDSQRRWVGGKTHLVQTGDVVDRGSDSRKALDLLRALEKEARRAGGRVHPLLGNHEIMRILGDWRYVAPGEYAAFATKRSAQLRDRLLKDLDPNDRSLIVDAPLGSIEMRRAFAANGEYGEWLREHDALVKINGIVFVHGGISPEIAGMRCEEINNTVRREIGPELDKTRAAPLQSLSAGERGPFWYRGLAEEPDTFAAAVDSILERQNARAIVVGHTVMPESRIGVRFGGKVIEIDTGMQPAYVPGGRASALEIEGGAFTAIYEDRRDVLPVAVLSAAGGSR